MTVNPTKIAENYFVAPQLSAADIKAAAGAGFELIVNNRPDGEMIDQPASADLETAAKAAGMEYAHIPVGAAGLSHGHIEALKSALNRIGGGKAVGFCKTGARSAFLYAYFCASEGRAVSDIVAEAANAGFDISAHAPVLEQLSREAKENTSSS